MHENNLPVLWLIAGFEVLILAAIVIVDMRAKRRPPEPAHNVFVQPSASTLSWEWRCSCGAGKWGYVDQTKASAKALAHALEPEAGR